MNNPFAKRFFQMVVDNVAGPTPFRLEGDVRFNSGEPDETANDRIEACWKSWAKKGNCEVTGQWSWNAVQRLLVKSLAMDGEILLRKLRGPEYGRHGFQLQMIDVDRLWEYKNQALPGGGAIHAGIEVDAAARPVAYHVLKRKPAQWQWPGYTLEFERIPAEDIIHVFVPDFAEQHRGMPWIYAALLNLVHLGAFEEAAVIAARIGAANMGFIESPDGGKTLADQAAAGPKGDGTDALGGDRGDPQISAQPGAFWNLPPGYKVGAGWNPKYPDAAIKPFVQGVPARHRLRPRRRVPQPRQRPRGRELLERAHRRARRARHVDGAAGLHRRAPAPAALLRTGCRCSRSPASWRSPPGGWKSTSASAAADRRSSASSRSSAMARWTRRSAPRGSRSPPRRRTTAGGASRSST
jgi:hypothetical protein